MFIYKNSAISFSCQSIFFSCAQVGKGGASPATVHEKKWIGFQLLIRITNSCLINLHYVDLGFVQKNTRVTFEAGNNVDFRIGTGKYRYSGIVQSGDLAAISRISEHDYEIRIVRQGTHEFVTLIPFATTYIGIREKRIGYLNNDRFEQEIGVTITKKNEFSKLPSYER